jgi:hypothetical protein
MQCGFVRYERRHFSEHLRFMHRDQVDDTQLDHYCDMMHLRDNGHNCYWCGFCNKLQRQDSNDMHNAQEVRFKHIGDHYDKDDYHVRDWICVEANRPKGELFPKTKQTFRGKDGRRIPDDDEGSDLGDSGIPETLSPPYTGHTAPPAAQWTTHSGDMPASSAPYTRINHKRRRHSASEDEEEDADNVSDDGYC